MTWRMLDLFSGIGGFSLAAQWVWGDELEIVAFCEIDKFCQKVLHKHWPDVPIIKDVRDVTQQTLEYTKLSHESSRGNGISSINSESKERETTFTGSANSSGIDLLTGGFPCQPFSCAGKRRGKEDDRFLWPEMFRIIKEFRPRWVLAENVAGIVRMALDDCLSDLEGEGYSTQAIIIPACAVNAPHRRDRVWIVAYDSQFRQSEQSNQRERRNIQEQTRIKIEQCSQDVADIKCEPHRYGKCRGGQVLWKIQAERNLQGWWSTEPDVGRVVHGVPSRVDRLKSLGNAIVPQVAEVIFRTIKNTEGLN